MALDEVAAITPAGSDQVLRCRKKPTVVVRMGILMLRSSVRHNEYPYRGIGVEIHHRRTLSLIVQVPPTQWSGVVHSRNATILIITGPQANWIPRDHVIMIKQSMHA